MGVDEIGVDKVGVDGMERRQSGTTLFEPGLLQYFG